MLYDRQSAKGEKSPAKSARQVNKPIRDTIVYVFEPLNKPGKLGKIAVSVPYSTRYQAGNTDKERYLTNQIVTFGYVPREGAFGGVKWETLYGDKL